MLGMGESSKPLDYKHWYWKDDADYIDKMTKDLFPARNQKFIFVADDWGSGVLAHFASTYNDRLLAQATQDPIALDGYPVKEIEAIGRASLLPYDAKKPQENPFASAMGAFDQTLW